MHRPIRITSALAALALAASAAATHAAGGAAVVEYAATYDVDYKQRNLGRAEFSVSGASDGTFVFESRTEARGLLRLARPNALLERSRFRVVGGKIRPLTFQYEDGSRSGEDNFRAEFDWNSGIVVVERKSARTEHRLEDGVLDRGSMQVALMRDLAHGADVGPYVLVDEDGLKTYRYERAADERIETPAGEFQAQVWIQQRDGSSRITRLWVVPALAYLPVRIAQFRDEELYTNFVLEDVEGLSR